MTVLVTEVASVTGATGVGGVVATGVGGCAGAAGCVGGVACVGTDAKRRLFTALTSDIPDMKVGDTIVGTTNVFGLISVNARSNPVIFLPSPILGMQSASCIYNGGKSLRFNFAYTRRLRQRYSIAAEQVVWLHIYI